jgi:Mg2+-importing ATPase
MATCARAWHRSKVAPKGLAASGETLDEISRLAPDEALHRVHASAEGLTPGQVKGRRRSVGPNQATHQARHTIFGELVTRSINPLNLLLLTLAAASFLSGD